MIDLNKPGELIIKQRYSPRMKLLLAVVLVLALLGSAGFIYNYGLNRAGFERQSAQQTEQTLQDEMRKLRDENQGFQESLARAAHHPDGPGGLPGPRQVAQGLGAGDRETAGRA